ncbi:MAG: efflux RND transporter periplasmic adaptor subunit, partial [Candidatus Eisenbacteria bacterium]|nr:efflux RND transporter periplasmic adaptor subunit [Candidatus Eisenbacteria bacterium]
SYFPGETIEGAVRFVEPRVSDKTRSVQVGVSLPNPEGRLRAGMYATATFAPVVAEDAVVISEQAVLRTGDRDVVVVDLGEGRFEPRTVRLGTEADGHVQVLGGLKEGDRIVTSAQFLIDSESNLQAAIQRMIAEQMGASATSTMSHGSH